MTTIDPIQTWLEERSINELDIILNHVQTVIEQQEQEENERRKKLSLRSDPSEIADAYGLDISGLMRDINKWK